MLASRFLSFFNINNNDDNEDGYGGHWCHHHDNNNNDSADQQNNTSRYFRSNPLFSLAHRRAAKPEVGAPSPAVSPETQRRLSKFSPMPPRRRRRRSNFLT